MTLRAVTAGSVALFAVTLPLSGQTEARPLSLRQVIDRVTRDYPAIQATHARVRAARGMGITERALGNPVFGYQVENAALPGRPAPPMDRETMMTASVPLEPLYQRWSRASRAGAGIRAAEADSAGAVRRIGLEAARAFYRVALAQVVYEAARDVADWLDTVVAYNSARVDEGAAAEVDLMRVELERDQAASEAVIQEAELARARAGLGAFLGDARAAGVPLVVEVDSLPLPMPLALQPEFEDRALDGRPDVRAARERIAAARAGVTSGWTMVFRELGVMVGTKRSVGTTSLLAGVSFPVPLFDQNRGEIVRAAAERDAATYDLSATERSARAEMTGEFAAATLLSERATALSSGPRTYLARADEVRRIALGAYREGAVPLIQVIDAARAWGAARLAYHQTLFAQHQSVLTLAVAQGLDLVSALPRQTP